MEGTFGAVVTDTKLVTVGDKATPAIQLELQVNSDEGTKKMYHNLWLTDGAWEYTNNTLTEVFGWDAIDIEKFSANGRECQVVVEPSEYDGKVRDKIKFINKSGGMSGVKPLTGNKLEEVKRRFNMQNPPVPPSGENEPGGLW